MKRLQVGIGSVSILKLNLRIPFMLAFSINDFHLTHEAHRESRLCKPVHFAILKEETVGVGTGGHVELNPLEVEDSRYDLLDSGNLSTRSHLVNDVLHHA